MVQSSISFILFSDLPLVPNNLRVTEILTDSVVLEWSRPKHDGGSRVKSYIIERREGVYSQWISVGSVDNTTMRYTATHLRPDTDYYFRVFAENDIGLSEPCDMSVPIRLRGKN